MITPLRNERGGYDMSFTLGFERTESGFPKFQFQFRPAPGFWLASEWFVPSTSRTDAIRLINRLWEAKATWDSLLRDTRLDVRSYFEDFNSRIPLLDHLAYREGRRSLAELSQLDAAYVAWGQCVDRVKEALREIMAIEDICVLRPLNASGQQSYFAYRRGMIWQSSMNLKPDQWKRMVDEEAEQRGIVLDDLGTSTDEDRDNRSVSVAVRHEVWRRDQGKCVACGSQERLEFDHIIPVAMGGSNTVRNIQLLCERCNREKAASLG